MITQPKEQQTIFYIVEGHVNLIDSENIFKKMQFEVKKTRKDREKKMR